ncbi:MAG: hypothetical protein HWD86_04775 [Kangiellaceae bacterium]|nr:hypothetical protein [Kangiellaceae bacterium]
MTELEFYKGLVSHIEDFIDENYIVNSHLELCSRSAFQLSLLKDIKGLIVSYKSSNKCNLEQKD